MDSGNLSQRILYHIFRTWFVEVGLHNQPSSTVYLYPYHFICTKQKNSILLKTDTDYAIIFESKFCYTSPNGKLPDKQQNLQEGLAQKTFQSIRTSH